MMRRLFVALAAVLTVAVADHALAESRPWNGTLSLEIGALKPLVLTGSGVATVNSSGAGGFLSSFRLAGGITGSGTVPVTDPDVNAATPEMGGLSSIFITASLGTGTFARNSPVPVDQVDLISGTLGTFRSGQSFNNETRGISVTVLGAEDRQVGSLTLRMLDTSANPTTVGARIYASGGALLASGDKSVAAGAQPPITIRLSATLTAGATYRIAFYSSSGSAHIFDPNATPYTENSGTFQVNGAFSVSGDGFPSNVNVFFPQIEVGIASGGPRDVAWIPVGGLLRFCRLVSEFHVCIGGDLTRQGGAIGVGVGGVMGGGPIGTVTPARFSLHAAPWTPGTATAVNQTAASGFTTLHRQGFAHDPASGTASTAETSGVIQLVTPVQIDTVGFPPKFERIAMFGRLTIHFLPEPGQLLLLGSGVVGLLLLGRSRMKQ